MTADDEEMKFIHTTVPRIHKSGHQPTRPLAKPLKSIIYSNSVSTPDWLQTALYKRVPQDLHGGRTDVSSEQFYDLVGTGRGMGGRVTRRRLWF